MLDEFLELDKNINIAVSGGVDSMALLFLITENLIKNDSSVEVNVYYVNHNVSKNSSTWATFVSNKVDAIKKRYSNINFHELHVEVDSSKGGFECAARNQRYEAIFNSIGPDSNLYVAHHKNDVVENVLINLFKGRGIKGLTSLRPYSKRDNGITIIRPLLEYSKKDLEDFTLDYIQDESNFVNDNDRNWIRNKVLPIIMPRFKNAITHVYSTYKALCNTDSVMEKLINEKIESLTVDDGYDLSLFNFNDHDVKVEIIISLMRKNNEYHYTVKFINECIRQLSQVERNFKYDMTITIPSKTKNNTQILCKKVNHEMVFYFN